MGATASDLMALFQWGRDLFSMASVDSEKALQERDAFNTRKVIVALTEPCVLFGLRSEDGQVVFAVVRGGEAERAGVAAAVRGVHPRVPWALLCPAVVEARPGPWSLYQGVHGSVLAALHGPPG